MVRVGGLTYACAPGAKMGSRIRDMRAAAASRSTRAGATRSPAGRRCRSAPQGEPIWEVVATYLRDREGDRAAAAERAAARGRGRESGTCLIAADRTRALRPSFARVANPQGLYETRFRAGPV